MFISKGKASIVLWIACIAIFLATLAPTVSRALTVASGLAVPSLEICSVAGGMNMLPAAFSTDAPDTSKGGMRMGDCPCCSMHAATLDIPPRPSCSLPEKSSRACCRCCSTNPPRPCSPGHPSSPAAARRFLICPFP